MRRKLQRLLRYKTQEQSPQSRIEQKHHSRFNGALSINKFYKTNRLSYNKQPFHEKSINLSSSMLKSKTNFRVVHYQNSKSNRNLRLTNIQQEKSAKSKNMTIEEQRKPILKIIKNEIKQFQNSQVNKTDILTKLIWIVDQIAQQIYSYTKVQGLLKFLNSTIKNIDSKSLIFACYCFSVQVLYNYGSYSLSIFYSDKALKLLGQKQKVYVQERQNELELYRTITKIFLVKNQFNTAKHFGYKFLRKTWFLNNFQRQLDAYDLLGKIYHEFQQKPMSVYFHERMCKGQRQNTQIIKISNYELQKLQNNRPDFPVFQTIEIFIQQDKLFHEMLEDRYRMKTKSGEDNISQSRTQFYFHTNRSPNRNLDTYRNLERRMIQQKKSKELHFIKPKQKGNLKKIISTFQKLLLEIKKQFQSELKNQIHSFK